MAELLDELLAGVPAGQRPAVTRGLAATLKAAMLAGRRGYEQIDAVFVDSLLVALDRRLGDQLDELLHHPAVQKLEAAWRGLALVVDSVRFEENIQVELANCSKQALADDFADAPEIPKSGLYRLAYTGAYATFGGKPYGLICADYEFGPGAEDLGLLRQCAAVAAMAHAPFITNIGPDFFGLQSFADLPRVRDLPAILAGPRYRLWHAFRDTEDARYVGLCLPRFLLRAPYRPDTDPFAPLRFRETVDDDHERRERRGPPGPHAPDARPSAPDDRSRAEVRVDDEETCEERRGRDRPELEAELGGGGGEVERRGDQPRRDEEGEPSVDAILARPECQWIGADLEQRAMTHAIARVVPEHLKEVRGQRLAWIDKTRAAVKDRLTKEIAHWDHRAQQLQQLGHDVGIYSFSLQYPSFLFPGKSQFTDEPAPEGLKIHSIINSITYKRMKTKSLPTGFFCGALRNNGLRADGKQIKLSGDVSVNIGASLPVAFSVTDFVIFKVLNSPDKFPHTLAILTGVP